MFSWPAVFIHKLQPNLFSPQICLVYLGVCITHKLVHGRPNSRWPSRFSVLIGLIHNGDESALVSWCGCKNLKLKSEDCRDGCILLESTQIPAHHHNEQHITNHSLVIQVPGHNHNHWPPTGHQVGGQYWLYSQESPTEDLLPVAAKEFKPAARNTDRIF